MASQSLSVSFRSRQSESETSTARPEGGKSRDSRRVRAAIYSRRRTTLSELEACLDRLKASARSRVWEVRFEYADLSFPEERSLPVLEALQDDAERDCFDALLVERLSDLARTPQELGCLIDSLAKSGVVFVSRKDGVDTSRVEASALISAVEAIERMRRELTSEKAKAALAKAKKERGTVGRPRVALDADRLRSFAAKRMSVRQIARLLKTSKSTVARALGGSSEH